MICVVVFFEVQIGLDEGLMKIMRKLFVFEGECLMLVRNININAEEANKIINVGQKLL